jgi:hypothetical protein
MEPIRILSEELSSAAVREPQPQPPRARARLPKAPAILDFGFSILDCRSSKNSVCSGQNIGRNRQADLFGGFEIDYQFKLRGLFDGKIRGLGAL